MNEELGLPRVPTLSGRVRLDLLHPRTGKVVKTSESDNTVIPQWEVAARQYARNLFISGNPAQPSDNSAPPVTMGAVFLSTGNSSLAGTEMDGTLTAWANKGTYVGASVRQGSVVAAECSSSRSQTVYVWEWPTTAGNGYVRSVGMCPNVGSDRWRWAVARTSARGAYSKAHFKMPETSTAKYRPDENMLWIWDGNGVYGYPCVVEDSLTPEMTDWRYTPTATASVLKAAIGLSTVSGIAVTGSHVYVAGSTSSIKKFTTPSALLTDPTESSISVSGRTTMVALAHDGTYLWVSEGTTVYRVNDTSGAIERSFAVEVAPGNLHWWAERNLLLVQSGSAFYGYDLNGTKVFESDSAQWDLKIAGGISSVSTTYMTDGYVVTHYSDYSYMAENWFEQTARLQTWSRSVLAAEIEKTNLTGMKLTYTFTFS